MPLITLIKSPMSRLTIILLQLLAVIGFSQTKDKFGGMVDEINPYDLF